MAIHAFRPDGPDHVVSALHTLSAAKESQAELRPPDGPEGFFVFERSLLTTDGTRPSTGLRECQRKSLDRARRIADRVVRDDRPEGGRLSNAVFERHRIPAAASMWIWNTDNLAVLD